MLMQNKTKSTFGDCEASHFGPDDTGINVEVWYTEVGKMWLCAKCLAEHNSAIPPASQVIDSAKSIDSAIVTKSDVFNAPTIGAIELLAAIQADDSILPENKEMAFNEACTQRAIHLREVIIQDRKSLNDKETELRVWDMNIQQNVARLRSEERAKYLEKYPQYGVNYQPVKVKKIKEAASGGSKKSHTPGPSAVSQARAAHAAAAKYPDVKGMSGSAVQAVAFGQKVSFDEAAAQLAKMLGKS